MASRVVPGSGAVSARSSPTSRLTSVDLPTLGRPITARSMTGSAPLGRHGIVVAGVGLERLVQEIETLAVLGRYRHGRPEAERERVQSGRHPPPRPSHLLATSISGVARLRRKPANCSSSGVTPARASISSRATSASAAARSVWARMRPRSEVGAAVSKPAVSHTRKRRGPRRPTPSRRSRVTPGSASTMAARRPTRRLNRVDFPTLGRPTIATVTTTMSPLGRRSRGCEAGDASGRPGAPRRRSIRRGCDRRRSAACRIRRASGWCRGPLRYRAKP